MLNTNHREITSSQNIIGNSLLNSSSNYKIFHKVLSCYDRFALFSDDCWLADTGAYAASSVISSKSSQNINDCKDWCNADAICQAFVFFSQKCVKLATETLTYKSG